MGSKKLAVDVIIPTPDADKPKGNLRKLYGTKIDVEKQRQDVEGRGKRVTPVVRNKKKDT